MKVSELEGALLDYWVAKAEGREIRLDDRHEGRLYVNRPDLPKSDWIDYAPSRRWSDGGPVIERERLIVASAPTKPWLKWTVCYEGGAPTMQGDTFLIAGMRCFVASKYGEEVPDDSER